MSKHLGNVLEPTPLMDEHGRTRCDGSSPPRARRGRSADGHDAHEIVRKVLLTYWNTASFLVLYANAGG